MTDTADLPQDLIDQGMRLPPAARRKFAALLLEGTDAPSLASEAARAARREMLAARIAEYQRGEVEAYSIEETLAAMDEAIREVEESRP